MNRHLVTFLALGCLAAAALAGDLPLFESNTDVGVTPLKGSAECVNGEYRITGGGANIWAAADAFHYVWKQVSGDVALTADVRFIGAGAVAHR